MIYRVVAPVYVISGWMRSGTSMMMRALEAGGMDAVYRQSRDEMKNRFADELYDPNIGGLYELERKDYLASGFPKGYEGKLIKALRMGPARMMAMPGGIKVVFMQRDHEEQRQSYMAFFGKEPPAVEKITEDVEQSLAGIRNRRDVDVVEIAYEWVVEHPLKAFVALRDFFSVPLDVEAAAAEVDERYYRYRIQELEVGIV